MRKAICVIAALVLCLSLAVPAYAAEGEFVPSITYKEGPEIESAVMNGQDVEECVVVTSIEQANNKSTDISQADRDLLLEVYEKLEDGSMTLPLDGDYVIRELVDVSFEHVDCREIEEHGHKDVQLKEEGTTLSLTFDLGIQAYADIAVLAYIDGQWVHIESVVNNGDGTVTCVFEDICPVAFVMEADAEYRPDTGDTSGMHMLLAVGLMILSAAGIVVLLCAKNRKRG